MAFYKTLVYNRSQLKTAFPFAFEKETEDAPPRKTLFKKEAFLYNEKEIDDGRV